jgi:signal transduction histidine kinase/streptogramin lyase
MKRVKIFIISFLISIGCLTGSDSKAQQGRAEFKPDQYRAINWTADDGLSVGIHFVLKDSKGFTWVGSFYGPLFRFDGAHFEKYLPDPNKQGTILADEINSLLEDSLHNIWVGTSRGLSRYDIKADTFTNFVTVIDSVNADRSTIPFWCARNDLYAIESGSRIVKYNIHTLQKKYLFSLSKEETNAINQFNQTVYDSVSNSLWMPEGGNGDSLHPGGGLFQISLDDGKRKHYGWTCYRNIPKDDHGSEAMRFDSKRNSIWINSPDGLVEFSLREKSFHFVDAFNELIKMKDYGRFVGVDIDREGRIWLATHPKGVLIYDPETKQIMPLFSDSVLLKKTGENNMQIYCDRDGIIWLTYWDNRGIYELLPYKPSVRFYPIKPGVKDSLNSGFGTIVPAGQGQIWMGNSGGVTIFNSNTGKFEVVSEKDMPGFKGSDIVPIYIDTFRQKAWLIGNPRNQLGNPRNQLFEMNVMTRKCRLIQFRDGSNLFDTLNIEGNLVQPYKNGLLVYDQNQGFFEIKKDSFFAELVLPFKDLIGRIVLEEDSLLFLKNPNYPFNYTFKNINGKWTKAAHFFDSLDWISLYYNKKDQTSWISLNDELVHYDKDFRKIKSYTSKDGYNEGVFNMLTDEGGNLWYVNGEKQVGRLNISTGIITTLSTADGYQPQFFEWFAPGAKDIQGNLYFGESGLGMGRTGLIQIFPEKYVSSNPSFVYFSALNINYKPFPLFTGVNTITELSLKYDQNSVSIGTGIIDYYSTGKSHIRYKLEGEGRTEDWQYGPAYYTIRYEGLAPGNYKLVLQASNAGSEFNGPEKVLFLRISPPWWQTWWARLIFISVFAFVLWSFIQYRSRNLKQRNLALEEKVLHRTKELKHSLEDLRATQTQLIQREKMASLGELTAGIAHEIQNPLNFVNNFSDINSEFIDEMKEEIKSGNMEEVLSVADIVKENNLKINHHGKRADSIVKGMLLHSRQSAGQRELTNVNTLADEYLRLSYHGLRAKDKLFNATMITDFDQNIEEINIVPQDIGRVFLNLFNNAFYAVAEKKKMQPEVLPSEALVKEGYDPAVSVSTKMINDQIEIRIKDNGMGIPEKSLDKIFQPFFTTKPTGEGTGLGLSLSYEIITKGHGGTIEVETKEGGYTEFIIRIPNSNNPLKQPKFNTL